MKVRRGDTKATGGGHERDGEVTRKGRGWWGDTKMRQGDTKVMGGGHERDGEVRLAELTCMSAGTV
jgi:hypothetical protein